MTGARKDGPSSAGLPEPLLDALKAAKKKDAKRKQIQEAIDRWAECVVDSETEPTGLLGLDGLQPRIAGPGLAKAWPHLPLSRRQELLGQLATMDKAFRARVLASFGQTIFPVDQAEAARALEPILESSEVKELLPAMLVQHQSAIPRLGQAALEPPTFWRVFFAFLESVSAGGKRTGPLFGVVRVGLKALSDPVKSRDPGALRLEIWLKENLATLAPEFRQEVPRLLDSRPDLVTALGLDSPRVRAEPPAAAVSTEVLPHTPSAPRTPQDPPVVVTGTLRTPPPRERAASSDKDQLAVLDDWLKDLRGRVACLDALGRQVREAREGRAQLVSSLSECEAQLATAEAETQSLKDQLTTLQAQLQVATHAASAMRQGKEATDADLSAERAAHSRTRQDHESTAAGWAKERVALLERVEQTARGRLDQFRQRVGDAVKKELGEPLPPEGTTVDGGLGDVLLVRLHGLLKLLKNEGFDL
jgi:hypothetical protein